MSPAGNPVQDGAAVTIANTTSYDAFPGVALLPNDDLLVVYRQGTDHASTFDGVLRKRISTDDGATWGSATTIHDPTDDARDPALARLSNDDLLLSFFEWDGATARTPYVMISTDDGATWGSKVAITNSFSDYAFISAPVIELDNGDLLAPLYGQDTGDSFDSARVSRSTDGGATWAHLADIVDGPTFGRHMQEPNLVLLDDGTVLAMLRSDGSPNRIYTSRSTDSGATWSTPVVAFDGSGRPAVHQRGSDGVVLCAYRASGDDCRFRASYDNGITWRGHDGDFTGGSTLDYMYAQWVALPSGQAAVVYSLEASATDADLYFSKLTG